MRKKTYAIVIAVVAGAFMSTPSAQATPSSAFVANAVYDGQVIRVIGQSIPSDKGVYVVECANTASQSFNPQTDCTTRSENPSSTLWFNADPAQQAQGASDPGTSQPFKVLRRVAGYDCMTSACALVTVRDHLNPSDMSMLSVLPLVFTKIPATASWSKAPGSYSVSKSKKVDLLSGTLKTKGGQTIAFSSVTPTVCTVAKSGTKESVTFKKAGTCYIVASNAANASYEAGSYMWSLRAS